MSRSSFGQIVIGPPGCGKTTYCAVMQNLFKDLGRKVTVVNFDPANESKTIKADIDLSELITLEDVMKNMNLGPNGALMYCMEFLEKNLFWLDKKLIDVQDHYFLFDCPGQVELYTHHSAMKNIILHMTRDLNLNLCIVQLIDSHYCSSAGKFIATVLMTLSTMFQLEMPQINVLSKIDIAEKYREKLDFDIDFYTDVLNMNYFLDELDDDTISNKYNKLNKAIISLVEDYNLVSFLPLNVKNRRNLLRIQREADKANGYVFGVGEERNVQALLSSAAGVEYDDETFRLFEDRNDKREKETNLSEHLLWI